MSGREVLVPQYPSERIAALEALLQRAADKLNDYRAAAYGDLNDSLAAEIRRALRRVS